MLRREKGDGVQKEKKVTEEEKKATNVLDFSFVINILSFVSVFFLITRTLFS